MQDSLVLLVTIYQIVALFVFAEPILKKWCMWKHSKLLQNAYETSVSPRFTYKFGCGSLIRTREDQAYETDAVDHWANPQ